MNFSRGQAGTNVRCESRLFSQGKTPEFTEMGENHERFVLTLFGLVLPGRLLKTILKVPEGHHPRGTTLREAPRGNFPLRGLCGGLSEGSAEGSAGSLRGSAGPRDFPRVFGVVTLCL